jgi:hypothetical protein
MKALLASILALVIGSPVVAGGLSPVVVEEVAIEETASSGGGIWVPLLFLAILAAVASSSAPAGS